MELEVSHFFKPSLESSAALQGKAASILRAVDLVCPGSYSKFVLQTEVCFNVGARAALSDVDLHRLSWLLEGATPQSSLPMTEENAILIEIGPRLNFCTSWSTNAASVCHAAGLSSVERLEQSTRTLIGALDGEGKPCMIKPDAEQLCVSLLHDRMTQCRYMQPLKSFKIHVKPSEVFDIDVMGEGRAALEEANRTMGLALDDWDLDFYTGMFRDTLKRNPTSVECFDLAQSNSEHSRHWFFKGRMVIDGEEQPESMLKMVMATQQSAASDNQVIAFADDSRWVMLETGKYLK